MTDATAATTEHGAAFAAVVESGNIMGVQFHPEKSGEAGLKILSNFLRMADSRTLDASGTGRWSRGFSSGGAGTRG